MGNKNRIIILIVAAALFMQNLETHVLGTALPKIAEALKTDPISLHMTLTAYLLSLAVFMPVSGWFADRYGTRTVFRVAVAIFVLASVACAYAPSLGWLVAGRVLQGIGGAMMAPVARLALLRAVPKRELLNAMTWVTIPAMIGPIAGPPVGGFIVTYLSWPWIFLINVPIGIVGIILATLYMDDTREERVPRFDIAGFVLVGIGFAGVVLGFETLGESPLPRWVNLAACLVGAVALVVYVGHARRTPAPVLDLSLLRVPTFFAGTIGGGFFRIGIGAIPFLLPLMLQEGFGYTPLSSGFVTLAAAIGAFAMKFGAPATINRFGFRQTLVWTTLASAASLGVCMLFTPATSAAVIFAVLLVGGFFRSLTFTAVNAIAYADIEPRQMSAATGFSAVAQQLSPSLGVGIAAMLLSIVKPAGEALSASDFAVPFGVVCGIVALSAIQFATLSPDAGNELSTRKRPAPRVPEDPSDST